MHAENLFAHQVSVHQLKLHEEYSVFCCVLAVPSACSGMCAGVEKQQIGHTMYHMLHLCLQTRQAGHTGVGLGLLCRRKVCRLPALQVSSHERFLRAGFDVLGARC